MRAAAPCRPPHASHHASPRLAPRITPRAPHRVQEMRTHISKTFRDKKEMTDVAQVSKMVAYGRMELEETLMLWKGDSHINNFFDDARENSKPAANPSFMDKFLSGRHV